MFRGPWMHSPHGHRGRFFERGGMKFLVLGLVKEQPRHGYEIIRVLEERSGGFYSPSPGAIYPTLQMLEDEGYVRASDVDGKKVYAITREGLAYLEENKEACRRQQDRMDGQWKPAGRRESHALMREMKQLFRDIASASWRMGIEDPEKITALRQILEDTKQRVEALADGTAQEREA